MSKETKYLKTLEEHKVDLVCISSILNGARTSAAEAFKGLYDLLFDSQGNKTKYLKTLEEHKVDLARISSILNGARTSAAEAFKGLCDYWFSSEGEKLTDHFTKAGFTLHNLSGMISGANIKFYKAFLELHNTLFNKQGKEKQLLKDFLNAGFKPKNLSNLLCCSGVRAASILRIFHKHCFEGSEKTKELEDFLDRGFSPINLCNILSTAGDLLKEFHGFCFNEKTKKYLDHLLDKEKGGFSISQLSNILHGTGSRICSALKEFHDLCFDNEGNQQRCLNDFYNVGFNQSNLTTILSIAEINPALILRNFYEFCFNKEKGKKDYLDHFLKDKFLQINDLCRVLAGAGLKICSIFKNLHDLCFNEKGKRTQYFKDLVDNVKNFKKEERIKELSKKAREKLPNLDIDDFYDSDIDDPDIDLDFESLQNDSSFYSRKEISNSQQIDSEPQQKYNLGKNKKQIQLVYSDKKQQKIFFNLSKFILSHFLNASIKSVRQGLYLPIFKKHKFKIDGECTVITRSFSQALFLQSNKQFLNNLETSTEIYERIAQGKQISRREEREVFALSRLLNDFEQQLDSNTNSLPLILVNTKNYKTLSNLSHYIAGVKDDFAIHLVMSDHVTAIYRIGNSYTYFDSNVAFISGLKSVDYLIKVVKKGIESAGYTVEAKGICFEHFNVNKANDLLSNKDKQVLIKEIKTEHQLLEEQDKKFGLIKINGQRLSRVQLYDFGTKINVEGSIPLLINADMELSSKKFQDHLDKKEVSITAREYLKNLKGNKNMEEIVQATKLIPFIGSKSEVEKAEQIRKPKIFKFPLEEPIKNFFIVSQNISINNFTADALCNDTSRIEDQLSEVAYKADNKLMTYLNDVTVQNQLERSMSF